MFRSLFGIVTWKNENVRAAIWCAREAFANAHLIAFFSGSGGGAVHVLATLGLCLKSRFMRNDRNRMPWKKQTTYNIHLLFFRLFFGSRSYVGYGSQNREKKMQTLKWTRRICARAREDQKPPNKSSMSDEHCESTTWLLSDLFWMHIYVQPRVPRAPACGSKKVCVLVTCVRLRHRRDKVQLNLDYRYVLGIAKRANNGKWKLLADCVVAPCATNKHSQKHINLEGVIHSTHRMCATAQLQRPPEPNPSTWKRQQKNVFIQRERRKSLAGPSHKNQKHRMIHCGLCRTSVHETC